MSIRAAARLEEIPNSTLYLLRQLKLTNPNPGQLTSFSNTKEQLLVHATIHFTQNGTFFSRESLKDMI